MTRQQAQQMARQLSFGAPIPLPVVPPTSVYTPGYSSLPFKPLSPPTPVYTPGYSSLPYTPQCQVEANIPFRLRTALIATLNGGGSPEAYALMAKLTAMLGYPNVSACLQAKSKTPDASGNF